MPNSKQAIAEKSGADEQFLGLQYLTNDFPYYNGKP